MTTATILSGPERRRRWSAAEKARIVEESLATETSVAEVARRHDIQPNLLHLWRRQARGGTLVGGRAAARVARSAGAAVIEVVLRNGRLLRVAEDIAPARVAALADVLEGCGR